MDLDFRRKLTEYGISVEEYNNMTEREKADIDNRINAELNHMKRAAVASGLQGLGCSIMLIPILIIFLIIIWALITS